MHDDTVTRKVAAAEALAPAVHIMLSHLDPELDPRDMKILVMRAWDLPSKYIAEQLNLSDDRVRHIASENRDLLLKLSAARVEIAKHVCRQSAYMVSETILEAMGPIYRGAAGLSPNQIQALANAGRALAQMAALLDAKVEPGAACAPAATKCIADAAREARHAARSIERMAVPA